MSLKRLIEEHPLVILLGTVVASFAVGWSSNEAVRKTANLDSVVKGTYVLVKDIEEGHSTEYVSRTSLAEEQRSMQIEAYDWNLIVTPFQLQLNEDCKRRAVRTALQIGEKDKPYVPTNSGVSFTGIGSQVVIDCATKTVVVVSLADHETMLRLQDHVVGSMERD
ncbi:hypothetical protein [Microbulbifer magnicolonia]|uniref:hypothetical protein n=1 Tax=Microbulbifer magnicolonia TaxID=3109744 RepID=UPI002B404466|nr:hypothetical protein [Microbulbifer sp. GG15]